MPPIGRGWTAAAWAYAFAWFLVNDRARLIVFRIMDRNAGRRA